MRTPPERARARRSLLLAALLLPQTDVLPGDPLERLAPEVREDIAALDPLSAGWESEARADAAGSALKGLAKLLEHGGDGRAALAAALFSERFEGGLLGLGAPVEARGGVRVWSAAPRDEPGTLGASALLDGLLARVEGTRDVHAKLKTVHVESLADGLRLRVLVLVDGSTEAGPFQVDALWRCDWDEPEGEAPRLRALQELEHRRVEAGRVLFSDCSTSLFGSVSAWDEQLLPGLPAWRARLDTRLGVPLLGHAAGIAVGDVDGDGLEDLYLCQPGGLPNKLLVHRPDGTVVDRSAAAGVDFLDFSRAALLVDLDGDGHRDLAVNAAERLLLLSNDGEGRFWLQAALDSPFATSLAAADVDLDGDLDLFACSYASPYDHSAIPLPYHDAENGKPNRLFENHGDWVFSDATAERGLDDNGTRFSFAASFEDFDLDGDPDLYVANDFGRNNLYRNDGSGHFVDVAAAAGVEDLSAGMGVSWGDYDGDGRFDLYVSNMYSSAGNRIAYQRRFQGDAAEEVRAQYQRHAHGNTLFRNRGDGGFEDVTGDSPLGVSMGRWAWGGLFADLNGDGREDLFSPNGFITEEREHDL